MKRCLIRWLWQERRRRRRAEMRARVLEVENHDLQCSTVELSGPKVRVLTPLEMIAAERKRQIEKEGYSPEHDDKHEHGEIARGAAAYLLAGSTNRLAQEIWPWPDGDGFKPTPADRMRELTKAGAMLVAEMERLQRAGA